LTTFSPRFSAADAEILEREVAYHGFFSLVKLSLRHRLFGGGWSRPMTREIFERGDAVAVLPWDPIRDELILVEQFRPGALREQDSPWMLELVAGMVADGETDAEVATREAAEEAGCTLDRLEPIATFYPSAGACSEQIRVFVGRSVSAGVGEIHGLAAEHEDLLVHAVSRVEALRMLDADKINNGHTLIALQWLARHGEALREQWLNN
jgi:ADP-ribose pyrophosphatase